MGFLISQVGGDAQLRAYQAEVARRVRNPEPMANEVPGLLLSDVYETEEATIVVNYEKELEATGSKFVDSMELLKATADAIARVAALQQNLDQPGAPMAPRPDPAPLSPVPTCVPRSGETVLALVVSTDRLEEALGDLEETFHSLCARRGEAYARRIYFCQVAGIVTRTLTSAAFQAALAWLTSK
jgi:hypothetical protein